MEKATLLKDLNKLDNLLQEQLHSKLSKTIPVQIWSRLREDSLLILVEHPKNEMPEQEETFDILEQTIRDNQDSDCAKVTIYLRVAGHKHPYASHTFQPGSKDSPKVAINTLREALPESEEKHSEEIEGDASNDEESINSTLPDLWQQPPGVENDQNPMLVISPEYQANQSPPQVKPKNKLPLRLLVLAGVGLAVVVFASSLYILSRPCVTGPCQAIPEAQDLREKSTQNLQNPSSGQAVLEAHQQIKSAISLLSSIPFWSTEHTQAQELLKDYREQENELKDLVKAMKTAAKAAYESQNPPHPNSKWMEIQELWRKAIAHLEQLPTESELQPLAQQKIEEYQGNLAIINQRLVKEQEAEEKLKQAQDAAEIAEARQGVAQSLPHWQLVLATWQTALNRLKEIPQGTMSYEEAQQLSKLYRPKMAFARERKTQEQIAANAYNQGISLAQLAKRAEENEQWSEALINWRNALTYINQVPRDTFYYAKAQSIVVSYQDSLKKAQEKLQSLLKIQQASQELEQICYGKTPVCTYSVDNNIIKVRLTRTYMQAVRQRALTAQVSGDSVTHAGIVDHVLRLEDALATVSNNAQTRLEVYTPDGALVEVHKPLA
ncbi:MAG: hypothetical protein WA919_16740 [Coleofasciculaceae cyanobacterium]